MLEIIDNSASFAREPEVEETPTHSSFEPINFFILVKRVQEDNSKKGSFIVPEKFRQQSNRARILSIGEKVTAKLSAGDVITFGIYNAETLLIDGVEHLLINEADIRGVERAL